jgi:hypothetical protein
LDITEGVLGYTKILQELKLDKGLTREVFASLHRNKKNRDAFTTVSAFTKAFEVIHENLAERISETFSDRDSARLRRRFPTLWSWMSDSPMKDLMSQNRTTTTKKASWNWTIPSQTKSSRKIDGLDVPDVCATIFEWPETLEP